MQSGAALKAKLRAGTPCIGAWILTASADAVEILGFSGLDFVIIDHEHGLGSIETASNQLRALKGSDCAGLLRVPSNDRIYIKRALDAGVGGIMVPNVGTATEAEEAVAACRYPPRGVRGAFGGMRAMDFGFDPAYYGRIEDELVIAAQIESSAAIDNIAAIGAVEGIDVLFIGPRDLSATLGKLNRFDDPSVMAEIARAETAIKSSGRALGSTALNGKAAKEMAGRGYRFIVAGSDAVLLGNGVRAMLADAR
ncbi:MAG: HpcH/HpaI aldolase/citrate lyase family protein [Reyranellaceae bacterium]